MKFFKKTITVLSVIILFFLAANIFAQVDKQKTVDPEKRAAKIADKMKTKLQLTDDQYTKVYNLAVSHIKWRQESKSQNLSKEERKAKNKEYKEELKKILTDEQYQKLKTFVKNKNKKNKVKKDIQKQ